MSQTMPQSHYDCPCMEKCPLHHAMQLIGGKWKVQILCSVNLFQDSFFGIIINQRLRLCMIYFQTLFHGFRLIVITKNELAATCVTNSFFFGWIIFNMIGSSTCYAGTSS